VSGTPYFQVIIADPPWIYGDKLPKVRGAQSHYGGMTVADVAAMRIAALADRAGCVCLLWIPDAIDLDPSGMNGATILRSWGFTPKQRWVWVKTKLVTPILRSWSTASRVTWLFGRSGARLSRDLAFGMGRLARTCHEIAIVGVRGNVYGNLGSKSERTVFLSPRRGHSEKPEEVQDALDRMFPTARRLELFARRQRDGWVCVGNEAPGTEGQDVRESIADLEKQIRGDADGG